MLRRLAIGLAGVAATAITIAGCASGGTNQTLAVGPSFAPQSLYATNSTQNGISIYTSTTGGGPSYQISTGGTTNGLNGPQYLTFDTSADIFATNWQPSLKVGGIVEIKASATGNVLPFNSFSFGATHPRGIADYVTTPASGSTGTDVLVVGVVDPSQPLTFASQLQLFVASTLGAAIETVAGPATGLNVPSGVAVDSSKNIYVTNLQGASVEVFSLPSPSPTPSPTATASPTVTPSPTATPTGATASPSPTPSPTATPENIAPLRTISGAATGINQPTGIALDGNGNIYISDQASKICAPAQATCPAILIFSASSSGNLAPSKFIAGSSTMLVSPTDVKVDSSGKIYVADSTASGAGVIYVFAAGANGNVAPATTFTSPGTVTGLGLAP